MAKILYEELSYEDDLEQEYELDCLFDHDYFQNKEYVVHGTLGLWDGDYKVYNNIIYNSLRDCITSLGEGYLTVYEEKYGKLMANISHHDGVNRFEIKELTPLGSQLLENGYDKDICERKGATRNVRFTKNQ